MLDTSDFLIRDLLQQGAIDEASVEQARARAAETNTTVIEALVEVGCVTSRQVAIARATISECPFVDLNLYEVNIRNAELLSRGVADKIGCFPLFVVEGVATVGMVDPMNLRAVDQVRQLIKMEIDPVLCDSQDLRSLITRAYSLASAGHAPDAVVEQTDDLTTGEEPIVAAVNHIIASAIDEGASDIHINPDDRDLHLRFRIDGVLQVRQGPALTSHPAIVQRIKVMAHMDLTQSRRPQDGKIRFVHHSQAYDLRISTLPTINGENVVLRVLARGSKIQPFEQLGFNDVHCAGFRRQIARPHGMILVTGPTGSGKTTTLYAALSELNSPDRNIMTIEDPVEIRLPLVRQTQVHVEAGLTFAGALRSMLRQDPDVVLVGEIRDKETAQIAVQASLTGHLVLSTMHTNDAVGAIARLKDFEVPLFAINSSLLCVIAQRLVRKVCSECCEPHELTEHEASLYGLTLAETKSFVRAVGCPSCLDTGYRGRIGVYELIEITPTLQAVIEAGGSPLDLRNAACADGLTLMWGDGLEKAQRGLTTLDEITKVRALFLDDDSSSVAGDAEELRLSA